MSSLDALVKVEAVVARRLIQKITTQNLRLQMKIFGTDEVHEVVIQPIQRKKHFELIYKGKAHKDKRVLTFKIEIATRLFFFKTESIPTTKLTMIPDNLEVFELARRREPRYRVPDNWEQSVAVVRSLNTEVKYLARIRDISNAGMKIVMASSLETWQPEEKITIQFKINKSPQITVKGTIRHIHENVKGGPTMGIHLVETSDLVRTKIRKICDDIGFYLAQLNEDLF